MAFPRDPLFSLAYVDVYCSLRLVSHYYSLSQSVPISEIVCSRLKSYWLEKEGLFIGRIRTTDYCTKADVSRTFRLSGFSLIMRNMINNKQHAQERTTPNRGALHTNI